MDVDNDKFCTEKGVDKADNPRISYFLFLFNNHLTVIVNSTIIIVVLKRERYNLGIAISVVLERLHHLTYHEPSKHNRCFISFSFSRQQANSSPLPTSIQKQASSFHMSPFNTRPITSVPPVIHLLPWQTNSFVQLCSYPTD